MTDLYNRLCVALDHVRADAKANRSVNTGEIWSIQQEYAAAVERLEKEKASLEEEASNLRDEVEYLNEQLRLAYETTS